MNKVRIGYDATVIERFFFEKSLELLSYKTLDSHRLRIHSNFSILTEIESVIKDYKDEKVKNPDFAKLLVLEAKRLIDDNPIGINFVSIKKAHLMSLFEKLATNKENRNVLLDQVYHATRLVIRENSNYINEICLLLENEITRLNGEEVIKPADFNKANTLINYFLVSLKNLGYNKSYLEKFIRSLAVNRNHGGFNERLLILKGLITRELEMYTIVLVLESGINGKQVPILLTDEFLLLSKQDKFRIVNASTDRERIAVFFEENKNKTIIKTNQTGSDYYSVTEKVRVHLERVLDLVHIGHSDKEIKVLSHCIVIGNNDPSKASIQLINYKLDESFKSSHSLYEEIIGKIHSLSNSSINSSSLQRIYSGIRHLRKGSESKELERELLNYWIGLEFIFSNYDADSFTLQRIRTYYNKCQSMVYSWIQH